MRRVLIRRILLSRSACAAIARPADAGAGAARSAARAGDERGRRLHASRRSATASSPGRCLRRRGSPPVGKIIHDADSAFGNFEGTAIDLSRHAGGAAGGVRRRLDHRRAGGREGSQGDRLRRHVAGEQPRDRLGTRGHARRPAARSTRPASCTPASASIAPRRARARFFDTDKGRVGADLDGVHLHAALEVGAAGRRGAGPPGRQRAADHEILARDGGRAAGAAEDSGRAAGRVGPRCRNRSRPTSSSCSASATRSATIAASPTRSIRSTSARCSRAFARRSSCRTSSSSRFTRTSRATGARSRPTSCRSWRTRRSTPARTSSSATDRIRSAASRSTAASRSSTASATSSFSSICSNRSASDLYEQ